MFCFNVTVYWTILIRIFVQFRGKSIIAFQLFLAIPRVRTYVRVRAIWCKLVSTESVMRKACLWWMKSPLLREREKSLFDSCRHTLILIFCKLEILIFLKHFNLDVTHERESSSSHQNFTTTDATTQTSVISSTLNNSIALINNSSMHNNDTSTFNSTPIPHDYTKSLTSPVTTITLHESTPRAHSVEQTTPFTKSNNTMPDTTRFNTNVTLSSVNTSSHDFYLRPAFFYF